MEESPLYLNVNLQDKQDHYFFYFFEFFKDTLGLQTLDRGGRLFRLSINSDHLKFSDQWFIENIIDSFLRDKSS